MEKLHMNRLRDLINRMRAGESERQIARDMDTVSYTHLTLPTILLV